MDHEEPEHFDRDALLMLYAAGEMPAEQMAKFEEQLVNDPALVADLQGVREAMDKFDANLRAMDRQQRQPVSDAVAIRRVERAMQQWAVDRLRRPTNQPAPVRRMPWWSYPTAAAALLIIGFLIWSERQPIPGTEPTVQWQSEFMMSDAEALADRLDDEFAAPAEVELAADDATQVGGDEMDAFFINPAEVATW
jgi:hypothetical protein